MLKSKGLAALLVAVALASVHADTETSSFPVRMIKLGAAPSSPAAMEHVRFCAEAGFNALWVYGNEAGRWSAEDAPNGPWLEPAFLRLAKWCRRHGMALAVSVNPVAETKERFSFRDADAERRIAAFYELLRRDAGVRIFVLSFDDQPKELAEVEDVLHYGRSAAPAHLDLARRLEPTVRADEQFWLCASSYCDAHLGGGTGPYSKPFLEGLPSLPPRIGIVWTGPSVFSPTIRASDIASTRARLGGRRILLYDNYPANDDGGQALELPLGPLRDRGPDLARQVGIYLASPMTQLGASRLPLLTTADYLRAPRTYDPDASWRRAVARIAGSDRSVRAALAVQAAEWSKWIDAPRYPPREPSGVATALRTLDEPSARAEWMDVEILYPKRMADLARLPDPSFREDVLDVMERRLAVARTVSLLREVRDRRRAGLPADPAVCAKLAAERRRLASHPRVLPVLEDLLAEAADFGASVQCEDHER